MSTPRDPECCQFSVTNWCGETRENHYLGRSRTRVIHDFEAPPEDPEPHEVVEATAITTWTCRICGREQDVYGEGAVETWMDCAWGCEASYLQLVV